MPVIHHRYIHLNVTFTKQVPVQCTMNCILGKLPLHAYMHSIVYKYTFFPKKIPVIYLVYTRFRIDESIYQVYARYIPCLNFVGFPDDSSNL